jgi:hypothetical protein
MFKLLSLFVVCGAVTSGCGGDPAVQFVGTYTVSGGTTYTSAAGNSLAATTINEHLSISPTQIPGRLVYNDSSCNVSAIASNNTYSINALRCPSQLTTDPQCAQCTITLTYASGTGTLVGSVLTVSATGAYSATCAGCTGTLTGSFTESFSGTKS